MTPAPWRSSWRQLPAEHRRWILYNALLGTAFVNLVLNAASAWVTTWSHSHVALWAIALGRPSTITDTVGTLFVLPFVTCLMCSAAVDRSRRRGDLPSLPERLDLPAGLAGLPAPRLRRSLVMGGLTAALLSPIAVVALVSLEPAGLSRLAFTGYKAILGVGLGALVTPLIAVRAMADPPHSGATTGSLGFAPEPGSRRASTLPARS